MASRLYVSILTLCLAFGLGLAACDSLKPKFSGVNFTGASWGREFRLPDPDGKERTLAEFHGKLVMVFFGYIQCAVVCPTALAQAVEARKQLGPDAGHVQILFVTLDPERDTPELVKEYVRAFDPSIIGLRGDMERTREAAKEFRVYFEKVPSGDSYSIDHTALTYIFDEHGRLRLGMSHMQGVAQYVADIRTLMQPES